MGIVPHRARNEQGWRMTRGRRGKRKERQHNTKKQQETKYNDSVLQKRKKKNLEISLCRPIAPHNKKDDD